MEIITITTYIKEATINHHCKSITKCFETPFVKRHNHDAHHHHLNPKAKFCNSHDGEKMVKHHHHKQHDIFRNNTKYRIKQSPSENTIQNPKTTQLQDTESNNHITNT
jgi:hypothetical protein